MFSNCRRYNAKDTPIAKLGIQLSDAFERQWNLSGLEGKCRQEELLQQKEAAVSGLFTAQLHMPNKQLEELMSRLGCLPAVCTSHVTLPLHQQRRSGATGACAQLKSGVRLQGARLW